MLEMQKKNNDLRLIKPEFVNFKPFIIKSFVAGAVLESA